MGQKQLSKLSLMLDQLPAAVDAKDLSFRMIYWNNEAEKIYGYTKEEVLGRPVSILYEPEEFEEYKYILNRVKGGEKFIGYRSMRRTKSGAPVEVALNLAPIENEEGEVTGLTAVSLPACEEISQVSTALHRQNELISLLKHDIETRIIALKRALDLLEAKQLSEHDEVMPQLLAVSRRTTVELIDFIENVLLLYGEGEIHDGLSFFSVKPASLISSIAIKLMLEKNLNITFNQCRQDMFVELDPTAFERAIAGAVSVFSHCDTLEMELTECNNESFQLKIICPGKCLSEAEKLGLMSEQLRAANGMELASTNGFGALVARRVVEAHGGVFALKTSQEPPMSFIIMELPKYQNKRRKGIRVQRLIENT